MQTNIVSKKREETETIIMNRFIIQNFCEIIYLNLSLYLFKNKKYSNYLHKIQEKS